MSDNIVNKNEFGYLKHQRKSAKEKMPQYQLLNTSAGLGLVKKEGEAKGWVDQWKREGQRKSHLRQTFQG